MDKYYAIGIYQNPELCEGLGINENLCIDSTSLISAKAEALRDYEADTLILVDRETGKVHILREV